MFLHKRYIVCYALTLLITLFVGLLYTTSAETAQHQDILSTAQPVNVAPLATLGSLLTTSTATVSFTTAAQSGSENVGELTITAQLSGVTSTTATVPLSVSGTATQGTDFTISPTSISFAPGTTSTAVVTITVIDDGVVEPDETVIVTMGTPTNATLGATTFHTATITDNDLPTVRFTESSQNVNEDPGTATVTIQLSAPTNQDVTVPFTVSGTASQGKDFTITTASPITITAGQTEADITITVNEDALDEFNETVVVTMGTPTNATLGTPTTHTVTIIDDDATPTVTFTTATQSLGENAGPATITAQLSAVSGRTVTVPLTTSGTATQGSDFSITPGTITIPAGSTTQNITISFINDTVGELDETVIVTMGTPTNANPGTTTVHTVTITNDDLPTVTFTTASQSVGEDAGSATITAQLSVPSGQTVTVPFTVTGTATEGAGNDFTITASPITFTAGDTTETINIAIDDDTLQEPNETVVVTLNSPTNASLGTTIVHTATITDNDLPTVTFALASQSISEGVGSATITAQLSGAFSQAVTVPFSVSGTATEGASNDFTITPNPLIIPANSTSADITITVNDDALDELTETVIVTMGTPVNANPGTTTIHTTSITDNDDPPTVEFTAASQTVGENAGPVTITAQLSAASGRTVTVPVSLAGSASLGVDFSSNSVSIPAGETSGDITITVIDDGLDEPDEAVVLTLVASSTATPGTNNIHTVTITDNDDTPTVEFTTAAQSVGEGVGSTTITAQLSAASGQTVTVPFTVSGTTILGNDFTITPSPITISAGSTAASISITVNDDGFDEPDETVIVTLGTPTNADLGTTIVHTATIADNEAPPTVEFTTPTLNVGEFVGTTTMTARLSVVSGQNVTVPFSISGTATQGVGDDFTITASPITIPAGQTTADITVTVNDDTLDEVNETIIATLDTPTNATLGTTTVHTTTITDNDGQPTVEFTTASQSAGEGDGSVTITAQLSAASGQEVTVPFSVSGTATQGTGDDFTIPATPITIPAGQTTADITVTVNDDALDEPDETVVLTLGIPTNAGLGTTTVHTATIIDNDEPPSVEFSTDTQGIGEGVNTTITAQLSAVSGKTVTVPFSISGTATQGAGNDFTLIGSSITMPAGQTTADITVTINHDALDEPDETVIVTLGTPTNATLGTTTVHTATITDGNDPPNVQFPATSQSVGEGAGTVTITAQLSAASGQEVAVPFTVSGTATQGTDFTITPSSITIPAGSTAADITITVIDDGLDEPDETVIVTLGTPTNATLGTTTVHTATITDDDVPNVEFTAVSQSVGEGTSTVTLTAQLSSVSSQDVAVFFAINAGGTAIQGTDFTITPSPISIPAGSTTADITITIIDDALDEPDETVVVTLNPPTNATLGTTTVNTTQGCSVLKDTNIVEKVIKVQAVVKECKADVLDVVLTQNVEGKTPQFGEDMRIGAHTRFVFAQGHITDIVISIFNTPMIADSVTKR